MPRWGGLPGADGGSGGVMHSLASTKRSLLLNYPLSNTGKVKDISLSLCIFIIVETQYLTNLVHAAHFEAD